MNHLQEIYQFDNSHFGKFNLAQHIVMMIVGDNVTCIGLYGTINKLVVVRVSSDKIEMIIGRKEYNVLTLYNCVEDKVGSLFPRKSVEYLCIFFQDFIGYTKSVSACQYRLPYFMICAFGRNALYKTIGVKYYSHVGLYSSFLLFFLLTEPLMKVHIVNFIKSLLVKNTLIPKLIKMRIKLLGIIIAYKLLDVIQFFIAFDACKHIKQIELGGVENSWLYAFHNLYPINSRCKDKH